MQSYFSGREAGITSNTAQIYKTVNKGSMLGPQQWNLILHKIIGKISETGSKSTAYADDLAIVIVENTRKEIEQKANTITKTIIKCQKQKLEISAKRSQMILLKGFLDIRIPPISMPKSPSKEMEAFRTIPRLASMPETSGSNKKINQKEKNSQLQTTSLKIQQKHRLTWQQINTQK